MAKDDLRQRVAARLRELGIGPIEAAQAVELERNFIRDFLEGKKRSFSQGKVPLVAQALKWSVADLNGAQARTPADRAAPKMTMVPLLDSVAAGKLKSPLSQIPLEDVPLLAFADLGRGEFFALQVDGDSMDRLSPEGSTIVVNKQDRTLIGGRCYIFALRGQTTFKMWQAGETPYLAPYSTNPMHKPILFRKRDLEVIGRVKRTFLDL